MPLTFSPNSVLCSTNEICEISVLSKTAAGPWRLDSRRASSQTKRGQEQRRLMRRVLSEIRPCPEIPSNQCRFTRGPRMPRRRGAECPPADREQRPSDRVDETSDKNEMRRPKEDVCLT